MEISLTNDLTFDEYHAGARLARIHFTGKSAQPHHLALAKIGWTITPIALFLMLLSNFLLGCGLYLERNEVLLLVALALLIGLFYLPFMERQWDRRIYKDSKLGAAVQMKLQDEYLSVTLEDATEVRIPWAPFSHLENENVIVLISPTRSIVLPKRLLGQDALDHVRTIVSISKGRA
jgi:hypothetical protein